MGATMGENTIAKTYELNEMLDTNFQQKSTRMRRSIVNEIGYGN